jgi:virginiamycin B lyase
MKRFLPLVARSILWWVFYGSNELVKFDPIARKILKTYALPSGRKMIIAADGRLWYMGSHSGKVGVID